MKKMMLILTMLLLASAPVFARPPKDQYNYEPKAPRVERDATSSWKEITPGLHGAVATIDQRFTKWDVPALNESQRTLKLTG